VGGPSSWEAVVDLDLAFARSRRRAAGRRATLARRAAVERRVVKAVVLGAVAIAAVATAARLVDTAPASTAVLTPSPTAKAVQYVARACGVRTPYAASFRSAARETGLPASLLVAVAWEESGMNPRARSAAGARGLLQLMPSTAPAAAARLDDPRTSIVAGARYLNVLVKRFDGDVELALAAYNAGPTVVERLGRAPTLATLRYAKNVEAKAVRLASC
jgi:soluble lytic murein transglycosylase-like protein